MSTREWNNLMSALENQLCILLVGPAMSGSVINKIYEPFTDQLATALALELEKEKLNFDPDSRQNLAYIAQTYNGVPNATELDAAFFAQSFYKKINQPSEALLRLAKLPFSLVINTTPDDLMTEAFRQVGKFGVKTTFYNYRRPTDFNFERPTADKPLVYNLFGSTTQPESLVLTAANQLDFIGKVMRGDPPIPHKLLQEFDNTKTFLFVGFDWREWHLQLLLRTLQLSSESPMLSPFFADYTLSRTAKEIYSSLFKKMSFVDDSLEQFVGELATQFQPAAPSDQPKTGKKIFLSAHVADNKLTTDLLGHLKILEQTGKATLWHEALLAAGENKETSTQTALEAAEIVVALISSEYLADDNLRMTQLLPAIAQRRTTGKKVVPVILEPCAWDSMPELTQLHPILPNDGSQPGKAITTWANADQAFLNVVEKLKELL